MQVGITKQLSNTNIYKNACATKQCEAMIKCENFHTTCAKCFHVIKQLMPRHVGMEVEVAQ
jgi:hypothetical protein